MTSCPSHWLTCYSIASVRSVTSIQLSSNSLSTDWHPGEYICFVCDVWSCRYLSRFWLIEASVYYFLSQALGSLPFLIRRTHTHTHTHTNPFNGLCPGLPGWASTRKVKPIWILLKQKTVSGSGIRWAICKSAPRSRQITMLAPHCSVFYRPDALPATQPTVSKHWDKKNCCTKTALIYKDKFYTTLWVKKNKTPNCWP